MHVDTGATRLLEQKHDETGAMRLLRLGKALQMRKPDPSMIVNVSNRKQLFMPHAPGRLQLCGIRQHRRSLRNRHRLENTIGIETRNRESNRAVEDTQRQWFLDAR